jgi:hypothetical protein
LARQNSSAPPRPWAGDCWTPAASRLSRRNPDGAASLE